MWSRTAMRTMWPTALGATSARYCPSRAVDAASTRRKFTDRKLECQAEESGSWRRACSPPDRVKIRDPVSAKCAETRVGILALD